MIYLTDGEGTDNINLSFCVRPRKGKSKIFFVDDITKERLELHNSYYGANQGRITQFIRKITHCKHIGFYICDNKSLRSVMIGSTFSMDEREAMNKKFKNDGFIATPNIGYDNYFYICDDNLNTEDDDYEFTDKMTKRKMANLFIDAQKSKRTHRVLATTFAKDFAV